MPEDEPKLPAPRALLFSAADLVYHCGGESRDVEVADFPRLERRMASWGRNGLLGGERGTSSRLTTRDGQARWDRRADGRLPGKDGRTR